MYSNVTTECKTGLRHIIIELRLPDFNLSALVSNTSTGISAPPPSELILGQDL